MRKCRIVLSSPKVNYDLLIDEEKGYCRFCKKILSVNIKEMLDVIEKIIKHWVPDKSKSMVVDGVLLKVYFLDAMNNMKELKYNDLTLPNNFQILFDLLEGLNEY